MPWNAVFLLSGAYLCGAVPTGLWLGRLVGVDVRATGSGNIGATNVARVLGARLGLLTLAADAAKGALPLLVGRAAGASDTVLALAGVAAFFGHIFPVFAGFRGGKGVATAAGVFLVLAPPALLGALCVYAAAASRWRIAAAASLCGGVSLPAFVAAFDGRLANLSASLVVAVTLVLTHRDNLRRMASGTEPIFRPRRSSR